MTGNRHGGRRIVLTPNVVSRLTQALRQGATLTKACQGLGVSRWSYYRFKRREAEREAVANAERARRVGGDKRKVLWAVNRYKHTPQAIQAETGLGPDAVRDALYLLTNEGRILCKREQAGVRYWPV